jgi:hypothetical protein
MSGVPGSEKSSDNSNVKKTVYKDFELEEIKGKLNTIQLEDTKSTRAFIRINPRYEGHALKVTNEPNDIFITSNAF